jgi:hypothetical protein
VLHPEARDCRAEVEPSCEGFFDGSEMLMKTTLWLFNIAMGNGPFIDGLPIKNRDFP